MKNFSSFKVLTIVLSVFWITGCSTIGSLSDNTASGSSGNAALSEKVSMPAEQSSKLETVFYFAFDQSSVKASDISVLQSHAQYLAANPSVMIRLEGHADERGTREYNIALGERRAIAVANILKVSGVREEQIEVISYGEEKPGSFMLNDQEEYWDLNRRVKLKYIN